MKTKLAEVSRGKSLRIAVLNKSGNVGKTTLVSCMMAPRVPNLAQVAYVELSNAMVEAIPGPIGKIYGAHEFADVENELLDARRKNKSMIVDFGASDFATTFEMLAQFSLFKNAIDLFVIPCGPEGKIQIDTVDVLSDIHDLGIDISRVRVLFNQVKLRDKKNLRRIFSMIFDKQSEVLTDTGTTFIANEQLVMFEAEVFKQIAMLNRVSCDQVSMAKMLADTTDYEAAVLAEEDDDRKFYLSRLDSIRGLAINTDRTLSAVFESLIAGV